MDRLSFVFSSLLIVLVTITFGSVIKAKIPTEEKIEALQSDAGLHHYPEMVPNRQQLESLLKRSHEPKSLRYQGRKMYNSDFIQRVIDAEEFNDEMLSKVLDELEGEGPKLAVGIENQSGEKWEEFSVNHLCVSDPRHTEKVHHEEVLVIGIAGTTDKGLIEVTSSFIKGINKTLAVMWFLRSRELTIGNLWNINLYHGDRKANDPMLLEMFHSQTIEADTKKNGTLHDSNLKFDGFMSKSGQATLKITVDK
ncbi:DELTA-thalatoxin-Avl1a-like [Acropora millepora]|uniref:DELTA-thalatoxin-Avl1a-like n=1 Tax=Acropora millepora TaxID=45264 RepID=UPI001CF11BD5|nr:DELTA-thalatoxin-Avl1a-like [Acropora millepora]